MTESTTGQKVYPRKQYKAKFLEKNIEPTITIPLHIWTRLLPFLRSPLSRRPEGQADRGKLSEWVRERAIEFLDGHSRNACMEKFLHAQGLAAAFEEYYAGQSALRVVEESL